MKILVNYMYIPIHACHPGVTGGRGLVSLDSFKLVFRGSSNTHIIQLRSPRFVVLIILNHPIRKVKLVKLAINWVSDCS